VKKSGFASLLVSMAAITKTSWYKLRQVCDASDYSRCKPL